MTLETFVIQSDSEENELEAEEEAATATPSYTFYHDSQGVVGEDQQESFMAGHMQGVVQSQYPTVTSRQGVVSFMLF